MLETVRTDRFPSTAVLTMDGDLDLTTAPDLLRAAEAALARGVKQLIIDMSRVTFMDSTGLDMLRASASCADRFQARVVLRSVPPQWLRVLHITNSSRLFVLTD